MDAGLSRARTLSEALDDCAEGRAGREPFLTYVTPAGDSREVTRADLWERALRLGTYLGERGLVPGDRVLLATRDDGALLAGVLACLGHGFSAVVAPPGSTPPEMRHYLELAAPAAALLDPDLDRGEVVGRVAVRLRVAGTESRGGLLGKLLGSRASEEAGGSFPGALAAVSPRTRPGGVGDSGEAYVLFTSGSTARPKGVPILRRGLLLHARTLAREYGYGPGSRVLCTLPLHHTDGLVHGALAAWLSGARALRPVRVSLTESGDLLDAAFALRATHWVTVPTQLHLVERFSAGREDAFSGGDFRCAISSAAPLDTALWERFEGRFGVRLCNLYGLTETVCGGLFCGPAEGSYRRGTVGRPVDCEVRLGAPGGAEPADGERGELWMRGPHLAERYLQEAGAGGEEPFREGWFGTGDLAVRDPDGLWRIVGRKKNLVICGGVNVQPEEVSEALASLPGVEEAVAFGVADETFGEALVACVVTGPSGPDEAEVLAGCARLLAPHKVPRALSRVVALPRGASGKVDLARARELFARSRPSSSPCRSEGDPAEAVLELAARTFGAPAGTVRPHWGPAELPRWDSFGHLTFIVELETRFGVRFSTAEILGIKVLSDAQRLVRDKRSR